MTDPDIFDDIVDDASVHEMRVGQVGTVKGKLEAVRRGDAAGSRRALDYNHYSAKHSDHVGNRWSPSIVITFSDWGMLDIPLQDMTTYDSIRYPLGTYVCVKVQCINENAEVMALAIWEMGGAGVPIPLGTPMGTTIPRPD